MRKGSRRASKKPKAVPLKKKKRPRGPDIVLRPRVGYVGRSDGRGPVEDFLTAYTLRVASETAQFRRKSYHC